MAPLGNTASKEGCSALQSIGGPFACPPGLLPGRKHPSSLLALVNDEIVALLFRTTGKIEHRGIGIDGLYSSYQRHAAVALDHGKIAECAQEASLALQFLLVLQGRLIHLVHEIVEVANLVIGISPPLEIGVIHLIAIPFELVEIGLGTKIVLALVCHFQGTGRALYLLALAHPHSPAVVIAVEGGPIPCRSRGRTVLHHDRRIGIELGQMLKNQGFVVPDNSVGITIGGNLVQHVGA